MPNIYQTTLMDTSGSDIYVGDSLPDAAAAAASTGLDASILLDGELIAVYSFAYGVKFV